MRPTARDWSIFSIEPTDTLFHFFAGLESHHVLFRYVDFVPSLGIASLTSRSLLDFEDSEVAQFDTPFSDKRLNDRVKSLLNYLFRLELREPNFLRDRS